MSDTPDNAYTRTWAPDLRSAFVALPDGTRVRHIVTGTGPDLLLLHTIRTQLDLFHRLVPLLASRYTVHAIDYPGFGWSDITPDADYNEPTLRRRVIEVIGALGLGADLHLVGESIGGALALTVASQLGPRIGRVTAINTYDYFPGIERASTFAAFIVKGVKAPIVGPVFAALENRTIVARIMRAGVDDPRAMPDAFIDELARAHFRVRDPPSLPLEGGTRLATSTLRRHLRSLNPHSCGAQTRGFVHGRLSNAGPHQAARLPPACIRIPSPLMPFERSTALPEADIALELSCCQGFGWAELARQPTSLHPLLRGERSPLAKRI